MEKIREIQQLIKTMLKHAGEKVSEGVVQYVLIIIMRYGYVLQAYFLDALIQTHVLDNN